MVSLSSKAIVDSGQIVFYAKNNVNIGRMPTEEKTIKSVDLPPDPADSLTESHADLMAPLITLTTDDDIQLVSPTASADRNLPPGDSGTGRAPFEFTSDHDDRTTLLSRSESQMDGGQQRPRGPQDGGFLETGFLKALPCGENPIMAAEPDDGGGSEQATGNGGMDSVPRSEDVDRAKRLGSYSAGLREKKGKTAPESCRTGVGDGVLPPPAVLLETTTAAAAVVAAAAAAAAAAASNEVAGNGNTNADEERWRHPAVML
eukprot:g9477.t1